jgi:filamentous hemagglutinin family protein
VAKTLFSYVLRRLGVGFLFQVSLSTLGYLFLSSDVSFAQVTSDGTVNTQVTQNGNLAEITGGETRGSNLFHSFRDFSVGTGETASFLNSNDIANIFSRVTGGNISNIDGLIRANGSANLFLINPAGIIFGENARLDVGGSFLGSTADSVLFEDGEFSATDLNNPPVLTINAPIGLNLRDNPQPIVNRSQAPDSSGLGLVEGFQASPGKNLALIGGDVNIERAVLAASGGRIELGGLSAAGTVNLNSDGSFSFPEGVAKSNVSLNNALVDVSRSEEGDGSLAVNAKNLELKERSQLGAGIQSVSIGGDLGSPDDQAGDIFINATDKIILDEFSRISNSVALGDIGEPGDINIITNSLSLTNGSTIFANTFGAANSGTVRIKATDISADGFGNVSGIFSTIEQGATGNSGGIDITTANLSLTNGAKVDSSTSARGNAGKINIITKNLSITNGSYLNASTFGEGDAGNIKINASDAISIDGSQNPSFTGIASQVGETATGNAGGIDMTTKNLSVTNGGEISTDTFGEGNAGDLTINVENFTVKNSNVSAFTNGIGNAGNLTVNASKFVELSGEVRDQNGKTTSPGGLFTDVSIKGQGKGGNLTIDTKRLSVSDGSKVQASTFGEGNSGYLTIRASDIDVFETPIYNVYSTGIFAEVSQAISSDSPNIILARGKGNAGNLTIETERLRIRDGGQVSVSTYGEGNAGTLTVKASDSIEVSGIIQNANELEISKGESFLAAEVKQGATGRGGNLKIETGQLKIANEGRISVSSLDESGTAGNLDIIADSIQLDQGIITAATAFGEDGNINLNIDNSLTLRNKSLISAQAFNNANGGNVNIDTNFIVAFPNQIDGNGNDIIASAAEGNGGNIRINAESLLGIQERKALDNNQTNDIDASSEFGLDGTVSIFTPDINPVQGATELPSNVVEAEQTTEQACQANREAAAKNDLIINGKGGIPATPDQPLTSQNLIVNGEITPAYAIPEPIETSQGKIQLARGIKFTKDGGIILTPYSTNNSGERIPEGRINCGQIQ